VQAESYYNILGYEAGTGDSPCNLWEEDQCKILTGGMSVQDFVDELQALCLTQDQMAKK
jgi:raffinose/stachyose/melibiose transport system substrate-binding protein